MIQEEDQKQIENKIKVVSSIKQEIKTKPKIVNYKNSIPVDGSVTQKPKDNVTVKTVTDTPKDDTADEALNTSKDVPRKAKVAAGKDGSADVEDTRDSELLK